jgi:hypothetical protein
MTVTDRGRNDLGVVVFNTLELFQKKLEVFYSGDVVSGRDTEFLDIGSV